MEIKQILFNKCQQFLDDRLLVIQNTISDIQSSLNSETKSSAGDKHETGRAMLQLEREKAGNQLAQIQLLGEVLQKISMQSISELVGLGSVVETTVSNYYIAISAGAIELNGKAYYAISANTPIAVLLLGKKRGDQITFREQNFTILSVS